MTIGRFLQWSFFFEGEMWLFVESVMKQQSKGSDSNEK